MGMAGSVAAGLGGVLRSAGRSYDMTSVSAGYDRSRRRTTALVSAAFYAVFVPVFVYTIWHRGYPESQELQLTGAVVGIFAFFLLLSVYGPTRRKSAPSRLVISADFVSLDRPDGSSTAIPLERPGTRVAFWDKAPPQDTGPEGDLLPSGRVRNWMFASYVGVVPVTLEARHALEEELQRRGLTPRVVEGRGGPTQRRSTVLYEVAARTGSLP
jgi:hypothetical protein